MSEKEEQKFQKILQKLEDSKNIGQGSWALPRNATTAEKTKYEICEKILGYQEDNNLSDEAMARKLHLNQVELEDILFCQISKFNLDYLMNVVSQLFSPAEVKVIIEPRRDNIPGLRITEAVSFDPNLEHQSPEYKGLYLLRELDIQENIELVPHTLRRCFATYNALNGMPLPVLQKVLGHSKISTTALYIKDSDLSNLLKFKPM
ncbi:104_t:CDS:2 [Entrophospora sp. SA101]|nr:104_t:CDS:2 [Entrophospora sp. SA101]